MKTLAVLSFILLAIRTVCAADDDRTVKVYSLKNGTEVVARHSEILAADGKVSYTVTDFSGKRVSFDSSQIAQVAERPLANFQAQNPGAVGSPLSQRVWIDSMLAFGGPRCWDFETLVLGPNGLSPLGSARSGVPSITDSFPVIGLRPQFNAGGVNNVNPRDGNVQNVNARLSHAEPAFSPNAAPVNGVLSGNHHDASANNSAPVVNTLPTAHTPAPQVETTFTRPTEIQAPPSHVAAPAAPVYNPPAASEPNLGGGGFTGRR